MYREHLDPAWRDEFDAWRGDYRNPFRDLQGGGRTRNWDDDRRIAEQESDGVVAEVVFPNTVPPFFPTGAMVARPPTPDEYPRRLAGIRAHNRWLAEWCGRHPERRAGVGQIFLNDVDDAVADVRWISGARPAGRDPAAVGARRRQAHRSAVRPDLRPAVGGVRGAGGARQQPLGRRCARLRALPGGQLDLDRRGDVLLPALARPPDPRRRVRALPPAALRPDRAGRLVDPAATGPARRLPRPDAHRPHRRAEVRARRHPPPDAERVLRPQRVGGGQLSRARARPRPVTTSGSTASCGAATTPTTRARTRTRGRRCGARSPTRTRPSCSSCWPATPPPSTASTSSAWRPTPRRAGRRWRRWPRPSTAVPGDSASPAFTRA